MKKIMSAAVSKPATKFAMLGAVMLFAVCTLATPAPGQAAAAAAVADPATTAKIHGHAQDFLYQPVANSQVELSTDGKTPLYTFNTDASGDYKGEGIKPGTYIVALIGQVKDKTGKLATGILDYQQNVKFVAGQDTVADFDMSRAAFVSKLPPEIQKQIVETRKANALAQKENGNIKNVNKLLTDARTARKAGNFDQAVALDTQATVAKPDVGLTWYELGDSDLAAKKYDAAAANYKKSLDIMATDKVPKPEVMAAAENNLGEALAKSGKPNDAVASYEAAAKADPTEAGKYFENEAIVLFKTGQADPAAAAADKAIAANPNQPIPYYIKGWALVQHATVDPKTNKIQLPPGCADAYHKFLDMQPTGPLADDARSILEQAGETVHKSYKKH